MEAKPKHPFSSRVPTASKPTTYSNCLFYNFSLEYLSLMYTNIIFYFSIPLLLRVPNTFRVTVVLYNVHCWRLALTRKGLTLP